MPLASPSIIPSTGLSVNHLIFPHPSYPYIPHPFVSFSFDSSILSLLLPDHLVIHGWSVCPISTPNAVLIIFIIFSTRGSKPRLTEHPIFWARHPP